MREDKGKRHSIHDPLCYLFRAYDIGTLNILGRYKSV